MDNKIYISDENGNEYIFNILFTFDIENKKYVLVYEDNDEDSLFPFIYNEEDNTIIEIEDEEEFNMVEEVLNAFLEDNEQ